VVSVITCVSGVFVCGTTRNGEKSRSRTPARCSRSPTEAELPTPFVWPTCPRPAFAELPATVPPTRPADTCAACARGRHPSTTSGSGACASGVTCPTGPTVRSRYPTTVYCCGVCACSTPIERPIIIFIYYYRHKDRGSSGHWSDIKLHY